MTLPACPHCGASNGEHKSHGRYVCMGGAFSLSAKPAAAPPFDRDCSDVDCFSPSQPCGCDESIALRAEVGTLQNDLASMTMLRDMACDIGDELRGEVERLRAELAQLKSDANTCTGCGESDACGPFCSLTCAECCFG